MDRCQIERCKREIAAIEAEIMSGNPDLPGLCLALSDWYAELRILEEEQRREKPPELNPAAEGKQASLDQPLTE
ncbi:MAG TPA: hypothetical protein VGR73_09270 [Bryobacteraceae bacterium]|nr:hypothetical protein [Bryobacteraceae bacterium]